MSIKPFSPMPLTPEQQTLLDCIRQDEPHDFRAIETCQTILGMGPTELFRFLQWAYMAGKEDGAQLILTLWDESTNGRLTAEKRNSSPVA